MKGHFIPDLLYHRSLFAEIKQIKWVMNLQCKTYLCKKASTVWGDGE